MPKLRILVVEDEAKLRALLKGCLEPEYDVLLAEDGQVALSLMAMRPDLIVLDLQLPRLGGLDLLRLLKTSSDTMGIPVVIVSAIETSRSLLDASALGAEEYLLKPCELGEIREAVKRQLFRGRPAVASPIERAR